MGRFVFRLPDIGEGIAERADRDHDEGMEPVEQHFAGREPFVGVVHVEAVGGVEGDLRATVEVRRFERAFHRQAGVLDCHPDER